jgi:hypothetical protein
VIVFKSYELTKEQEDKVKNDLAESKKHYESIAHLVFESEFDAGAFFEYELDKIMPE